MKLSLFIILILNNVYAQIAIPSLFSENRSINPAAISSRKAGQMTAILSSESLERIQDHSEVFGAGAEVTTNTTLNRASNFRGGRGGNEPRVEHIVNFSLGDSKGLSFGISGFISKTENDEASVLIANAEDKLPSTSKAQGIALKLGYVF